MLFLYDILYAPKIWWNLTSVVVLLDLCFNLNFYGSGLDLYSRDLFYRAGYILDSFIVLDVERYDVFVNSCFSLNASSNSNDADVNVWHPRVGHTDQDEWTNLQEICSIQFWK